MPSNYLPISLLPSFHKLLETIMCKQIKTFLIDNTILYEYQFGFRSKHSTNFALLDVVQTLYEKLDSGCYGLGIYLDLQKAFDTVDHDILLWKLHTTDSAGKVCNGLKAT